MPLFIDPKQGTQTNDSPTAGKIGEVLRTNVLVGSAVSLSSGTAKTVASLALTGGDWDINGRIVFAPASGTIPTFLIASASDTTDTLPTTPPDYGYVQLQATLPANAAQVMAIGGFTLKVASGGATYYLIGRATFSGGSNACTAYGVIEARRAR